MRKSINISYLYNLHFYKIYKIYESLGIFLGVGGEEATDLVLHNLF